MTRNLSLTVKDTKEFEAIKLALEDEEVRAFVLSIGYLLPLTPPGRTRVLTFVADKLDASAGQITLESLIAKS